MQASPYAMSILKVKGLLSRLDQRKISTVGGEDREVLAGGIEFLELVLAGQEYVRTVNTLNSQEAIARLEAYTLTNKALKYNPYPVEPSRDQSREEFLTIVLEVLKKLQRGVKVKDIPSADFKDARNLFDSLTEYAYSKPVEDLMAEFEANLSFDFSFK